MSGAPFSAAVLVTLHVLIQLALIVRVLRGVDTTIIFPARNDSWIVGAASRN